MKKKKIIWGFLYMTTIASACGFIANGVFWYYQQLTPFLISFNVMMGGAIAGLTGYVIAMVSFLLHRKIKGGSRK